MVSKVKFEKVSYNQFLKDWIKLFGNKNNKYGVTGMTESMVKEIYDSITLPVRSTHGSAGYDFKSPFGFSLREGMNITIPTGIRCKMDDDTCLLLYPRSGHGFRHGVKESNTVGIIDSDYYNADNEGHIMVKLVNEGLHGKALPISFSTSGMHKNYFLDTKYVIEHSGTFDCEQGDKFIQGIFFNYITTEDDDNSEKSVRVNGFGSTDKGGK